jgi:hypothetical protein
VSRADRNPRRPRRGGRQWNKPDATRATFVDGWLRSGDLARIDDEGLVYIVDRAKDMINRGGENVYCVEVENALAAVPGVVEAAVVGVPDEVMGEKVGAVLVPAPGAGLDADGVLATCTGDSQTSRSRNFSSSAPHHCPATPAASSSSGGCGRTRSGAARCTAADGCQPVGSRTVPPPDSRRSMAPSSLRAFSGLCSR